MFWWSHDEQMEHGIETAIHAARFDPDSVDVRAARGIVTLSGEVACEDEHRLLAAVYSVPGVRGILNRLESQPRHAVHIDPPDTGSIPATA